jgi:hypothetical protein
MESIAEKFKGAPPFPTFAYTSKGAYLLQQGGWDRIARTGAKILLKKRFTPQLERTIIQREIDSFKEMNSLRGKLGKYMYTVLITWGILSVILGWLLCKYL